MKHSGAPKIITSFSYQLTPPLRMDQGPGTARDQIVGHPRRNDCPNSWSPPFKPFFGVNPGCRSCGPNRWPGGLLYVFGGGFWYIFPNPRTPNSRNQIVSVPCRVVAELNPHTPRGHAVECPDRGGRGCQAAGTGASAPRGIQAPPSGCVAWGGTLRFSHLQSF